MSVNVTVGAEWVLMVGDDVPGSAGRKSCVDMDTENIRGGQSG